ncbi:hypothetical protein KW797_01380 [Candidatus Parcubacteria bacterium]|nr:hypothetical protein [Candidatus Parcubacteria bacterium]
MNDAQKDKLRTTLHEKLGIYLYGEELDRMLEIVHAHAPKAAYSKLTKGTAEKETDEAIERGDSHANAAWKAEAIEVIEAICLKQDTFIADDVWEVLDKKGTHDPRALGGIMRRAKNLGLCETTGRFASSKKRHMTPMIIWKSLLFGKKH